MKKFKAVISLLLVLLMALSCLSLAGCGEKKPTIEKDKTTGDEEVAGTAYEGIEEYAGSTIKFATWIDHTQGEGAVPMTSFAEKYDIEVVISPVPEGDYVTKISGLIGAGQSPDMIVDNFDYPDILALAMPLDDVKSIDLTDEFWDQDLVNGMGCINGKHYYVNSLQSPWTYRFMCFYNIKLFEDNGFKTPGEYYEEDNWNIKTFESCASQIAKLGDKYVGASVRPEFAAGIWEASTNYYKDGKFVSGLENTALATAFKWSIGGKEKGIFSTSREDVKFKANECGMLLYGDFGLRSTGGFEGMDPDIVGYVPMPKVNATDKYYPSTGTLRAYGICKGSKNAEATGYFLRHFLDFKNYDRETMFKSDEASEFYDKLREMEDHCHLLVKGSYEGNGVIMQVTSAQVDTALKSVKNQVDAIVAKQNATLEDVKNKQGK